MRSFNPERSRPLVVNCPHIGAVKAFLLVPLTPAATAVNVGCVLTPSPPIVHLKLFHMGQQLQALGKCAELLGPPMCREACPLPTLSSPPCATALVTNSQEKKVKVVPGQAIYALCPFSPFWDQIFFFSWLRIQKTQPSTTQKKKKKNPPYQSFSSFVFIPIPTLEWRARVLPSSVSCLQFLTLGSKFELGCWYLVFPISKDCDFLFFLLPRFSLRFTAWKCCLA